MGVCHYRGRVLILLNVRSVVESEEEIDMMDAHELAGPPGRVKSGGVNEHGYRGYGSRTGASGHFTSER